MVPSSDHGALARLGNGNGLSRSANGRFLVIGGYNTN